MTNKKLEFDTEFNKKIMNKIEEYVQNAEIGDTTAVAYVLYKFKSHFQVDAHFLASYTEPGLPTRRS